MKLNTKHKQANFIVELNIQVDICYTRWYGSSQIPALID